MSVSQPESSSSSLRTWWVDDVELFPNSLMGLGVPNGGFFMAVEGGATDDGKVFLNPFGDEETLIHVAGVVHLSEVSEVLGQAKTLMRSKAFKAAAIDEESEHGAAFWRLDDEKALVAVFSTQRSPLLVDNAWGWFGETHQNFDTLSHGLGDIRHPAAKALSIRPAPVPKFR